MARRYGLAPEVHGKRAVRSAAMVRMHLRSMRGALKHHECRVAFDEFTSAAIWAGHAAAEGTGTGMIRHSRKRTTLRGFTGQEALKSAATRFHKVCAVRGRR